MAGILLERRLRGLGPILLTPENWESILATGPSNFPEKVERLLSNLPRKSSTPGSPTTLSTEQDRPLAFAGSKDEFTYAFQTLREQGFIEYDHPSGAPPNDAWFRLTYSGWKRVHELEGEGAGSLQAFIAMTRRPNGKEDSRMEAVLRQGLEAGIIAAGYAPVFQEDQQHANKIDDQILVNIRRSRFVVVDATGRNPNVMFEAGFALGLGKTVLWTCQDEDHQDAKYPFDIRQYKRIPWQFGQEAKLAQELRFAIENVVGRGFHTPGATSGSIQVQT